MLYKFINDHEFGSWEDFEQYVRHLSLDTYKGRAFEEFAYAYFLLNKDLYNIKEIYMQEDIPEKYRTKYRLASTDVGVDGLIITDSDESIAYQVKFRSDNSSATYSELSTFWAESEYCDRRCIFSNCEKLPNQSEKKKNQFQILLDSFLTLDEEFFKNLHALATNDVPVSVTKYEPLAHQNVIINDVLEGFKTHDRGKVIAACGTGKTLTALWIKERLEAKKTLFVVPSLALIRQTLVEWKKQCEQKFEHLVVCSDTTVVDTDSEVSLEQSSASNIPVTTNPEIIKNFLQRDNACVVFSTYQSLESVASAMVDNDFSFDLIIFDEAHRTAGSSDSKMFSIGLEDTYIKANKRLFMTATEKVVSPRVKKLASEAEYTVFSMDDSEVYGPVFSRLDFGTAIQQNIISDYKVILSVMNSTEIANILTSDARFSLDGSSSLNIDTTIKQFILAKAIKNIGVSKIVSYHSTVAQAKGFAEGKPRENLPFQTILENTMNFDDKTVYFSHVNGTMSSATRSKIFNDFKNNDISLMTNASCLTEGVDLPAIDTVYFVNPKNSIISIIQAIGRALRKSKDKKLEHAYIILPVIIDDNVANFNDINPEQFATLHTVLQALRDQDRRLAEEIDALNYNVARGHHGRSRLSCLNIFVPETINLEDFADTISLRVAEINKNISPEVSNIQVIQDRHSNVQRVFRTIGDYNIDAYKNNLVDPTIEKYESETDIKNVADIRISNNNISHTRRLGLIEKVSSNSYCLTDLGKKYKNGQITFDDLFVRQTLRYFESTTQTTSTLFPYRAFLKLMKKFDNISKLEFLYAVYTLTGTKNTDIDRSAAIISDIREQFPNIEILSEENKKKVLHLLNLKYGTEFSFVDVWTSRTTTSNQFNFLKNHVLTYNNVFFVDGRKITKQPGANVLIDQLLALDADIETLPVQELETKYKKL